jgi:hypothetical protein
LDFRKSNGLFDFHATLRPDPALDFSAFDQGFRLDDLNSKNGFRFV